MIYCFWISKEILFSSSFFLFFLLVSLITSFLKIQFVFCTLISFFSPHSSFMYFECQVSKPGKVFGSKTWMGFGAVKKKWKKFFFSFSFWSFHLRITPSFVLASYQLPSLCIFFFCFWMQLWEGNLLCAGKPSSYAFWMLCQKQILFLTLERERDWKSKEIWFK